MHTNGNGSARTRTTIYCVVPWSLAGQLHDLLRRHFRDDNVQVVVEQRARERRRIPGRRLGSADIADERRRILNEEGRRIAERRALAMPVEGPRLPRKAQSHAEELVFYERIEPAEREALDRDTDRIVARIQSGDGPALHELYMRYFDSVYGYARVALRDSHEAEDVVQTVFMRAMQGIPRYEIRSGVPFRCWLFHVARNVVRDTMRRRQRHELSLPEDVARRREGTPTAESDAWRALDWISDSDVSFLVERLPLAQRQAIVLRYMLDFTTDEIAISLERSPTAIRILEHRGLRTLEDRLTALGRRPTLARRAPMLVRVRAAPVLRGRRFALNGYGSASSDLARAAFSRR